MTRADELRTLQVRYLLAVSEGKRKTASLIFARIKSLSARQQFEAHHLTGKESA